MIGVDGHLFEDALDRAKRARGVRADVDLDAAATWAELRRRFLRHLAGSGTGEDFPRTRAEQLDGAIAAVFASWNTPRAITYRRTRASPTTSAPP